MPILWYYNYIESKKGPKEFGGQKKLLQKQRGKGRQCDYITQKILKSFKTSPGWFMDLESPQDHVT